MSKPIFIGLAALIAVNGAAAWIFDAGWPAAPNLKAVNEITEAQRAELVAHLRERWPGKSP